MRGEGGGRGKKERGGKGKGGMRGGKGGAEL